MRPFDFCPSCATQLEQQGHDGGRKCPGCGRSWYRNAAPTAGCVIVQDSKALVTVRGREPEKGRLDVPGGFLGPQEDPIEGLRREIREELGLEIDVSQDDCVSMTMHTYGPEEDPVLAIGFIARLVSGEPAPADDVADIRWVTLDELDDLDFAWPHDRELVRKALRGDSDGG